MRSDQAFDPRPTLAAPATPVVDDAPCAPVFDQAGVALIGVEGTRIAAFNTAAEQLFYRSANSVRGLELSSLFVSFHQKQIIESLRLASRGVPSFPSLLASRGHAAPTEVDVRVGPLTVGGKIVGATLVVLDVRLQNRSLRELRAERDSALASEAEARKALRRSEDAEESLPEEEPGTKQFPGSDARPEGGVNASRQEGEHDTLVPGLLVERALPEDAAGVLHLSEALYSKFDGQPKPMFRVVRRILKAACSGGPVRVRGQIQASRSDWSLLRIEIVESEDVFRDDGEWTLLRRRVTELEGGLGHEHHGIGERRIWMTFNLKRVGTSRSSRPPRAIFAGLRVAIDVKSPAVHDALAHRLSAWKASPSRYAPQSQGELVISDTLPAGPRVIRLGTDLRQPILRHELREQIVERVTRQRQSSSRPLKSSLSTDEPSSYEELSSS